MKAVLTFSLLLAFQVLGQTGSIQVRCSNSTTNCYWSNEKVYCHQLVDNERSQQFLLVDSAFTDDWGWLRINNLPAGLYQLTVLGDTNQWSVTDLQVQAKQLFVSELTLSALPRKNTQHFSSPEFVGGTQKPTEKTAPSSNTITRTDISRMPTRSASGVNNYDEVNELEQVAIVAYSVPLIDRSSGSSYQRIRRDNLAYGEVNSQNSMMSRLKMTPGVTSELQTVSLASTQIRGGRSDANAFYIDGIRVRESQIPNSTIGSVTVISGGIPANYGDVTGGVFLIETRNGGFSYGSSLGTGRYGTFGGKVSKPKIPDPVLTFDRFSPIYENQFLSVNQNQRSTFGLDVDRASWTYCKRIIEQNGTLARDAVKAEEFINAFSHKNINVSEEELVRVEMQRLACPWNEAHQLVAVHLKATDLKTEIDKIHHQFTFLIDVSGSMSGPDRLPLIQEGLKNLVESLDERDRIAIVTYAGAQEVALPPTTCDDKNKIYEAIDRLGSGGSTNGMGGLKMAYELAEKIYDPQANNRVILCTDGDFNVGISNPKELENYIATKRRLGIYLTAIGVGMGNYRNDVLETLADRGDGNHFYVQNIQESNQVLVKEIGNLLTVARDVKLDVQFNPNLVSEYRLIGYENRLMPSEHFRDDTKDGGEIGVNHQVVAVYEIVLGKDTSAVIKADSLILSSTDLAAVALRFKPKKQNQSIERSIHMDQQAPIEDNPSLVCVTALALELRNSPFKGMCSPQLIQALAEKIKDPKMDELKAVCRKIVGI